MKKHLSYAVLLTALLLTACGHGNNETQTIRYELELEGNSTLTEDYKQRQYLAYLENYLKEDILESLSDVKSASVTLSVSADSDILISSNDEISVDVVLDLQDELSTYSAAELADILAKAVGNTSTDDITILDADENRLFPEE